MPEPNWKKIAEVAQGTCLSECELAQRHDCADWEDEIGEKLLDYDIERCEGCGWWHESCELESTDSGPMCVSCL